jgi:hypothetical protein
MNLDQKVNPAKSIAEIIASESRFVKNNYLTQGNLSWSYLRYRILRPLLKIYKKWNLRGMGKDIPWLTPAAIIILDNILNEKMKGLEYGSGKSTLFNASRIKHLESVEHHATWYKNVTKWLQDRNITNVTYHLFEPGISDSEEEIEIRNRSIFDRKNENYAEYINLISSFSNDYFDFILIDGRARVECCQQAIGKLKSGGIFILDNSERTRYQVVHDLLDDWDKVNTTTGLTDTTFWFKP